MDALAQQLDLFGDAYRFVDGDDIAAALDRGRPLPARALWITFDDGHPDALAAGELLAARGVRAMNFVCPSVIGTTAPFWWQVLDAAQQHGLVEPGGRRWLKTCPDSDRRAEIDRLRAGLGAAGVSIDRRQPRVEDLQAWRRLGHEVGNHSWDHPVLPTCPEDAQRMQVRRAHEWLHDNGMSPRFFAYPNGDWSPVAEEELHRLGYRASFLFDHRLTVPQQQNHQRLSRLRLDSDAGVQRARAIVSGAHPAVFQAARKVGLVPA
ncbi:MAG: polysaccharide deacetylase family protein [Motilibacteraceae bacterium]